MLNYFKIGVLVALATFFFTYIHTEGVSSECFDKSDCGLWHFVCENGICKCDWKHIPDRENKWCVVDILKPCGYQDKCYDPHAVCVDYAVPKDGICKCKEGYTLHEKKYVCSVVIGNNCTTADECIEGNCNNKICTCIEPLESDRNGTKCLPALNKDCSQFGKCAKDNAICNSNSKVCECEKNFKEAKRDNGVFCLAMLDYSCKNKTDCADNDAECKVVDTKIVHRNWRKEIEETKICACGTGFVLNPKVSECLKIATEEHDSCTEDIQCSSFSGFGSQCTNKKCQCKSGFYFDIDFKRCVRSCLCGEMSKELSEMKLILKELFPVVEFAMKSGVNVSETLQKIRKL